jgi:dihydrofolate reductase
MAKLRVESFTISLDGFGAGPQQSLENPLGIDDDFAARGFRDVGAWILGRNMFGPVRGPWPDESWRAWWGENPVYKVPVFVLTHHARAPLVMEGGTTFHFVTQGIEVAVNRAREAAQGKDVRVGGGVDTIRQCLRKRLVDELHIAVSPVLLGSGERLFEGVDLGPRRDAQSSAPSGTASASSSASSSVVRSSRATSCHRLPEIAPSSAHSRFRLGRPPARLTAM